MSEQTVLCKEVASFARIIVRPPRCRGYHVPNQGGTSAEDDINDAASAQDGSIILAGGTYGAWSVTNEGDRDFAAVKLSSSGGILWRWQVVALLTPPPVPLSPWSQKQILVGGPCAIYRVNRFRSLNLPHRLHHCTRSHQLYSGEQLY